MGFLRILLVIVIMFSGYASAAHGVEIAAIQCCDHPEEDGCEDGDCGGCLVQAAVVTNSHSPAVFFKPSLQPMPARKLSRDAVLFPLRPPNPVA